MRFHYIRVFEINFNHVPWTIRVTTPAPGAHHLGTPLGRTTAVTTTAAPGITTTVTTSATGPGAGSPPRGSYHSHMPTQKRQ